MDGVRENGTEAVELGFAAIAVDILLMALVFHSLVP